MNFTFAGALRGAGDTTGPPSLIAVLSCVCSPHSRWEQSPSPIYSRLGRGWLEPSTPSFGISSVVALCMCKWREIDIFAAEEKKPRTVLAQEAAG
jgi:hypothetical protein